jgi:glucokinase
MKYYIGIDLDQSTIKAGIVDQNGTLLCKESIKTRADRKANEIVRDTAYLAQKIIETSKISMNEILAIGIGSPGIMNNDSGIMTHSLNLPLQNINLRTEFRRIIPLPVYIESTANCKALAESFMGASAGMNHSITITVGNDIEGGVIINRRIYSGFNHAANGLGHFIMVEDGQPCSCGRNGCFSAYASETALISEIVKTAKRKPNSLLGEFLKNNTEKSSITLLFDAMRYGDETAKTVIEKHIVILSLGLANIISLFMPEAIILDGEFCRSDAAVLPMIMDEIEKTKPYFPGVKKTQIKSAQIQHDAEIIGAAMLAMISKQDGLKGN